MNYWEVIQGLTPLSVPFSCLFLLPQTLGPYIWPSAFCESAGRAAAGSDLVKRTNTVISKPMIIFLTEGKMEVING